MARPSNIPTALIIPLYQKWENGMTGAQMQVWLKSTHNIDATVGCINKRIKTYREESLQATLATVRESASEKALNYISMLDNDIVKLNRKTNKLLDSEDKDDLLLADKLIQTKKGLIIVQLGSMVIEKSEKEEQDQEVMTEKLIEKLGKSN